MSRFWQLIWIILGYWESLRPLLLCFKACSGVKGPFGITVRSRILTLEL